MACYDVILKGNAREGVSYRDTHRIQDPVVWGTNYRLLTDYYSTARVLINYKPGSVIKG